MLHLKSPKTPCMLYSSKVLNRRNSEVRVWGLQLLPGSEFRAELGRFKLRGFRVQGFRVYKGLGFIIGVIGV